MARQSAKQLAAENDRLRQLVNQQSQSQQSLMARAATQHPTADLWVGVRNISDNTLGIKSPFKTEPDLDLHADLFPDDPSRVAVISYAWWLQLRRSTFVNNGLVTRDDSVLGSNFTAGPPDRPEELAQGATVNAIPDVEAWLVDKTELELKAALNEITSEHTFRRLRRHIDDLLRRAQKKYALDDKERARKAYRELPALLQFLDNAITERLERPVEPETEE